MSRSPYVNCSPPEYLETDDGELGVAWNELDGETAAVTISIGVGEWETFASIDVDEARAFLEDLREQVALAAAYEASGEDEDA